MIESPDEIVNRYGNPPEKETYQIFSRDGEAAITCRKPTRYSHISDFKRGLRTFWEYIQEPALRNLPGWQDVLPLEWDEAVAVFTLYYNSCEPTKFSQLQAAKMVRAPFELEYLVLQIERQQSVGVQGLATTEVEEAKKDSMQTDGSELGSPSAETPFIDTPTA